MTSSKLDRLKGSKEPFCSAFDDLSGSAARRTKATDTGRDAGECAARQDAGSQRNRNVRTLFGNLFKNLNKPPKDSVCVRRAQRIFDLNTTKATVTGGRTRTQTMFGKTKEISETDERAELDNTIGEFFGDETAVEEATRVDQLHHRVTQVEQQISSQFTSLAAYAQIAQEQVELVRSEAQHANERSEQRVVGLIERERADRISAGSGGGVDVIARLDALENQVADIREGLQQCLSNQKALAEAITDLFTSDAGAVAPSVRAPEPAPATPHDVPPPPAAAANAPALSETLPPPPAQTAALHDLDHELEELGVSLGADVDDFVAIAPVETTTELFDGPIDGLSLA